MFFSAKFDLHFPLKASGIFRDNQQVEGNNLELEGLRKKSRCHNKEENLKL